MRVSYSAVLMALFLLVGCATAPKMVWLRTDGQRMAGSPALTQQAQIDATICSGERQRADLGGVTVANGGLAGVIAAQQRSQSADEVAKGCMAQKGYLFVPEDKADEISANLAATAAQRNAIAQGQSQGPSQTATRR